MFWRRALITDRTAARTRRATSTVALIKAQLNKRLRHIGKIDAQMLEVARKEQNIAKRREHLISIPRIGKNTALMILVDMPEIGSLTTKQVGSLAGLAPMSQSSGKWQGKARILGGRPNLRHAIFMPALVAIRFNLDMTQKYAALITAGKGKKEATSAGGSRPCP